MNEIGIDLLACLWIQAALRLIERSGARELPESFGIPLRLFLGDNGRSQPVGNLSIVGVRLKHFRDLLLSRVVILLLQRNPPERRVREKFRILLGFFPVGVVGCCRFLIGGEEVVEIRDQTLRRLLAGSEVVGTRLRQTLHVQGNQIQGRQVLSIGLQYLIAGSNDFVRLIESATSRQVDLQTLWGIVAFRVFFLPTVKQRQALVGVLFFDTRVIEVVFCAIFPILYRLAGLALRWLTLGGLARLTLALILALGGQGSYSHSARNGHYQKAFRNSI